MWCGGYWDTPEDATDVDEQDAEEELASMRDVDDDSRYRFFRDGDVEPNAWDFAAYTSPIYLTETSTTSISGQVIDGRTSAPVTGAPVEFRRTSPVPLCVTRTTGPDGIWSAPSLPVGNWVLRGFPPSGDTGLATATADLGRLDAGGERSVTLTLPARTGPPGFIDPSGVVVDTDGDLVEGATVTLAAGETMGGPFTPVPDGGAVMSPDNRTNPGITGGDGVFAWDVLAGWYTVEASKPGCTSVLGDPTASSGPLRVPPPALDLRLVLDCRPADDADPVLTVTGAPPGFTNQTAIDVDITVTDDQPVTVRCALDPVLDEDMNVEPALAPCPGGFAAGGLTEGPHQLVVIAADERENVAVEVVDFTVDVTGPAIDIGGVTDGGSYPAGEAPTPTCTAEDPLSGLAGPCTGATTAPEGGSGSWTYTATATDRAANTTTSTVTWTTGTVWPFDGFLWPVVNDVTIAYPGWAVPVRFRLGGDRGQGVIAEGWPRSAPVACTGDPGSGVDGTETDTYGSNGLWYIPWSETYLYLWKTDPAWSGTCRRFTLRLTDGSEHRFTVHFL